MAQHEGARIVAGRKALKIGFDGRMAVDLQGKVMDAYAEVDSFRIRFKSLFVCAGAVGTPLVLRRSGIKRLIGDSFQLHPMMRLIARFPDQVNEGAFGVPVRQILEFAPQLTLGCSVSALPHLALWLTGPQHDAARLVEEHTRMAAYYVLASSDTMGSIRNLPLINEPFIRYQPTRNDFATLGEGLCNLGKVLFEAGAEVLFLPLPGAPSVSSQTELNAFARRLSDIRPEVSAIHLFGACPLGSDAARAPLDPYGRVRGTDNVFVNDVSMLPGGTGVNPQGTLMAVAQRNIFHFLEEKMS